jgi:hypothetical protein
LEDVCFNSGLEFYLIVAKEHLTTDSIEQQLKINLHLYNDHLFLKPINTSSKPDDGLIYIDIEKGLNPNSRYKFGIASIRRDSKNFDKFEFKIKLVMNDNLQNGEN